MEMSSHVAAIQADLAAAAALGDESSAAAGRRLSEALGSSLHLRLLDLLSVAAIEVTGQLSSAHVEVRLSGRDAELVVVQAPEAETDPTEEASARITLRLADALKTAVEAAAAREGVSVNTWIVRTLARALDARATRVTSGNRLRGFAQS